VIFLNYLFYFIISMLFISFIYFVSLFCFKIVFVLVPILVPIQIQTQFNQLLNCMCFFIYFYFVIFILFHFLQQENRKKWTRKRKFDRISKDLWFNNWNCCKWCECYWLFFCMYSFYFMFSLRWIIFYFILCFLLF
jgi:hypothetical protein